MAERPRREFYETPEGLNYLTYLYRDLKLTDEEAAKKIGISRKTLFNWRKASSRIENAISLGKQFVDTQVENALLKAAFNGNVTAMIFWLKNRKYDKWSDRQNIEVSKSTVETATEFSEYLKERMAKAANDEPSSD